jgi:hypothetical protein
MITIETLEARRAVLIKEREQRMRTAQQNDAAYAGAIGELERWIGQLLAAQAEPQPATTTTEEEQHADPDER